MIISPTVQIPGVEVAEDAAGQVAGTEGEQRQLALAKALFLDPKVLCIDELSLGLAPSTRRQTAPS